MDAGDGAGPSANVRSARRRWGGRRWATGGALAVLLSVGTVGTAAATLEWDPAELGPEDATPRAAPALATDEVRVVTFNAWKLFDAARVPRYLEGVDEAGALLASASSPRPEILAVQEVESRAAERALVAALETTHWVDTCDCDVTEEGELGSAVALAIARDAFRVTDHRCIPLGEMWPDHPRCAIEATLARVQTDPSVQSEPSPSHAAHAPRLSVVAVHMAWHPDNEPMAHRLVEALPTTGDLLVLGDFNTWAGRGAYDALLAAPLSDARPGAPPTTVVDRRVDLVLYRGAFEIRRGLDRRASYDRLVPTRSLSLPGLPFGLFERACEDDPTRCPISDHLPEGVVLAWTR